MPPIETNINHNLSFNNRVDSSEPVSSTTGGKPDDIESLIEQPTTAENLARNKTPLELSRQSTESDYSAADAGSLGVSPPSGTTPGSTDQGYAEADAGSFGFAQAESAARAYPPNDYVGADAGSLGIAQSDPTTKTIQESLAAIARKQ